MPTTDVTQDRENLTLVLTARFAAEPERVWQVWQDPRRLERWWGPPQYPATVVDHDLRPGGSVTYFMTGPDGDKHHGWWRVLSVNPPHELEFEDGFGDDAGQPTPDLPVTSSHLRLAALDGGAGTEMVLISRYPSLEALDQVLAMGMVEGITAAVNQIDALLAA